MTALIAPAALADSDDVAMVSVQHGINGNAAGAKLLGDPMALGKDAAVDIYVNDGLFYEDFTFRQQIGPVELAADEYNIKVKVAGTDITIIDQDVTVSGGDNVKLVASFGKGGAPELKVKKG
jgi:hypothetical protein